MRSPLRRLGVFTFDYDPPIGGQGRLMKSLTDALPSAGAWETVVFTGGYAEPRPSVRSLVRSRDPRWGPFVLAAATRLRADRIAKREALDVLLLSGGPGGLLPPGKRLRIPCAYHANHTYAQQFEMTGRSYHAALAWVEERALRDVDLVTASSSTTAASVVDAYGVPRERVHVLHPGVDTTFFTPGSVAKGRTILFVGRFDKRKGIDVLLDAWPEVAAAHPDARLKLVGEGPLLGPMRDQARALGVAGSVEFAGRLDDAALLDAYREALAVVLPSQMEGFGMTLVEAMSCGTAVVGSEVAGIVDVIRDGHNGTLAPPRDPARLAAALRQYLDDPAVAASHGKAGREMAQGIFAWSRVAARLDALLRSIT